MDVATAWDALPGALAAKRETIDVFRARLDVPEEVIQRYRAVLSADERRRADAFVFERDAHRFMVARGVLRLLLARYRQAPASAISLCYGRWGKPYLGDRSSLQFSVSHSDVMAVYAVADAVEVGVDVEIVRHDFDVHGIAEVAFSERENAALREVAAERKIDAFFACWTRKEAFVKASGRGLSMPLKRFSVSLSPGEPAALLETSWAADDAERWSLQDFSVGPGYAAALAGETRGRTLRFFDVDAVSMCPTGNER